MAGFVRCLSLRTDRPHAIIAPMPARRILIAAFPRCQSLDVIGPALKVHRKVAFGGMLLENPYFVDPDEPEG